MAQAIEGYASQVRAVPGDEVQLFVKTSARALSVQAFRMGYYQGLGACLTYQSDQVAGAAGQHATAARGGVTEVLLRAMSLRQRSGLGQPSLRRQPDQHLPGLVPLGSQRARTHDGLT